MTWEERWHPLREEWIIIAAHRQHRPWHGETIEREDTPLPTFVSDCYLCPGNVRVSGKRNADYTGTYVFDNDHPCVGPDAPDEAAPANGLYRSQPARGIARVVCYSPRHNLTLAELEVSEIENLLRVWQQQYVDLGSHKGINHVLIFENKGEAVGVSNPHPHCQIYATNFVFKTIETEARVSQKHLAETGRVLFRDILKAERQMFTVHAPVGSAKLASDSSTQTFLEFSLDSSGDRPTVLGRTSRARGRQRVIVDERPVTTGKAVGELTEEDVAAFLVAELPKLVGGR